MIRFAQFRKTFAIALLACALTPAALLAVGQNGTAHAAVITQLPANILNNSSYPIISLSIDHQQVVPGLAASIPPGSTLTLNLSIGAHSYTAQNGLDASFAMYTFNGNFSVRLNHPILTPGIQSVIFRGTVHPLVPHAVVFNDPTIAQLLTRFGTNGVWVSNQFIGGDGTLHANTFSFRANGTYTFSVDGNALGNGTYSLVSRSPGVQTVTFNVGGSLNGIFSETQGMFLMKNDPNGNALEYT